MLDSVHDVGRRGFRGVYGYWKIDIDSCSPFHDVPRYPLRGEGPSRRAHPRSQSAPLKVARTASSSPCSPAHEFISKRVYRFYGLRIHRTNVSVSFRCCSAGRKTRVAYSEGRFEAQSLLGEFRGFVWSGFHCGAEESDRALVF